ncbi:MAG TPA: type II secretion system F family protein [Planctomicrobium sp.]|nr:type II secretion system F family protein [Planctomicrobium sp.]
MALLSWRAIVATGVEGNEVQHKTFLKFLGGGLLIAAIAVGGFMVTDWYLMAIDWPQIRSGWPLGLVLLTLIRMSIMMVILFAAQAALRISVEPFRENPSVVELAIRAGHLKTLLLSSLAMLTMPLLAIGALPLLIVWFFGFTEYALFELITRSQRCRLLWSLAVAVRFQKPLDAEVLRFSRTEGRRRQQKLQRLALALEEGNALSDALSTVGGLLSRETIAAIRVGEQTGQLEQVLQSLARLQTSGILHWFSRDYKLHGSFFYVLICLWCYLGITSFFMYNIIPKFKSIFYDFGVDLPEPMRLLIQFSDTLFSYWPLFSMLLIGPLIVGMYLVLLSLGYEGRYRWLAETVWPRIRTPGLLKALSVAVKAQAIPSKMLEGEIFGMAPSLERSRLERVCLRLNNGQPLGTSLFDERFLNTREAQALQIAEQQGHLAWALESLGRRLEAVRNHRVRTAMEFLKPVTVIVMGAAVFFVCLSILSVLIKLLIDLS